MDEFVKDVAASNLGMLLNNIRQTHKCNACYISDVKESGFKGKNYYI